jgi:hypothetical protein
MLEKITALEEYEYDYWFMPYIGYGELIKSFEYQIALENHDEDYQGDSRYIFKDKNKGWGFLIFGWGSCSGCDALQACRSKEEVYELRDQLHHDIKWYETADELLTFIEERDWELQWCWHVEETRTFLKQAIELLANKTGRIAQPILDKIFAKYEDDE